MTPSIIFCRSSSRKSRNGGPALLLTRISGSGQAANSAFWPSGEATSAATAMILAPVALRSSSAVAEAILVAAVDDDLAAGLGQPVRAGRGRARGSTRRRSPCGRQSQIHAGFPHIYIQNVGRSATAIAPSPVCSRFPNR
jgi:hypothetical protein